MRRKKSTQATTVLKFKDRDLATLKVPADYLGSRLDYWDTKRRGLGLRVDLAGRKVWSIMYRHKGVKRRLVLGVYQAHIGAVVDMSLADARRAADAAFGELARGKDPAGEKVAPVRPAVDGDTFSKLAALYIQACIQTKRERTWREYERTIKHDLLPVWGSRLARDISRADIKAVVTGIQNRGKASMANRLIATIGGFFSWCVKEELLTVHPAHHLDKTPELPREIVLSDNELRALWQRLDHEPVQIAAYFRLCLLSAQRRSEVLGMRWPELDLKTGIWAIPPERTKNKRQHKVPLVQQALQIVRTLRGMAPEDDGLVFTELASVDAWVKKLRQEGLNARPHDLRRTASTIMGNAGVPEEDIGRILNHTQGGVTGRHYNMYPYEREKLAGLRKLDSAVKRIIEGRDRQDEKVVALHA
jgi:integrase